MAARSVTVNLKNNLTVRLKLDTSSLKLPHGEWDSYPPSVIGPKETGTWETESDGFATGTEGYCTYLFAAGDDIGTVQLHWDNPFVGSNSYGINVDPNPPYFGDHTGGSGDNATVTFSVQKE